MFRTLVIWLLAAFKRLSIKEVAAAARLPYKKALYHLHREHLDERVFERLLAGVRGRPAEVALATQFIEGMEELRGNDLTAEEADAVGIGLLEGGRLLRRALLDAVRLSRTEPSLDAYPRPCDLEPARWRAARQWEQIRDLPPDEQWAVVHAARAYQSWALMERVCEESVAQASRNLERAAALARLAREIAERVRGPEGWRNRVRGHAMAFEPNVLRVRGDLKAARVGIEEAKRLWLSGEDPDGVLDPGRVLELEASLCRAQRRFEEALALLDEALGVSRCPARVLINKGFTLEVLGEYQGSVDALLQAAPLLDPECDPRLWYQHRFNLAVNLCHQARYREAADLVHLIRDTATSLRDEVFLIRLTWLEGRIAGGLGRLEEALILLEQSRHAFSVRKMSYDVALSLLETAALLLAQGRASEVKELAHELAPLFESQGVHRESLAALRIFYEASEREEVSGELTRRILGFLYRARHDPGIRFELRAI